MCVLGPLIPTSTEIPTTPTPAEIPTRILTPTKILTEIPTPAPTKTKIKTKIRIRTKTMTETPTLTPAETPAETQTETRKRRRRFMEEDPRMLRQHMQRDDLDVVQLALVLPCDVKAAKKLPMEALDAMTRQFGFDDFAAFTAATEYDGEGCTQHCGSCSADDDAFNGGMVYCEGCGWHHIQCLGEPVPEGTFFCRDCRNARPSVRAKRMRMYKLTVLTRMHNACLRCRKHPGQTTTDEHRVGKRGVVSVQ